MVKDALSNNFKNTLEFLKNPRVHFMSYIATVAGLFSILGMLRNSPKEYLHSLGISTAKDHPIAIVGEARHFGSMKRSLSDCVPRDTPLQRLHSSSIQKDQPNHALVTIETAQRLSLTPETTENALNTSVEKQANKTKSFGVSVGMGPTLNIYHLRIARLDVNFGLVEPEILQRVLVRDPRAIQRVLVSDSRAVVQVYTRFPLTKAQGSFSWDLKNGDISVGVGKSRFIAGIDVDEYRLGLLVGADVHVRLKAAANPGFGGFGLTAFAGPAINF